MSLLFKKIGILGRQFSTAEDTFTHLINCLKQQSVTIQIDQETASAVGDYELKICDHDKLAAESDLMIVVGGDGSLLKAARAAVKHSTPIVGINRGRLGFLTDIMPDSIDIQIPKILAGKFIEEKRYLLSASIELAEKAHFISEALNDIVLLPGREGHMVEYEIYINNELVCMQRADGIIITTPTGSTAYALSGGGPILHPTLDAIALVPMFPHTLSSRPIVVRADSEIKVKIPDTNHTSPRVSCDGQQHVEISPGESILIKKLPEKLRLLHPQEYNYFETLRSKLGWETKH